MDTPVSYTFADGVAVIAMDDGKANALGLNMLAPIDHGLDRATSDEAVVVLTGRSGIFSGGFDLKVLRTGGSDATRMLTRGFELALRLLTHRAPVVVACNGHAVAMGAFLLLAGDYRVGVDGAYRLVANEVAIGLTMPWAAIEICRQRLGPAHFHRAVNLAEAYSPSDGEAAGFLDRVVEAPELLSTALSVAGQFAALDRVAFAGTKRRSKESAVAAITQSLDRDLESFAQLAGVEPPPIR